MRQFWWQLPGPSDFISRIEQDLRDAKNIVLLLPQYGALGLLDALRPRLSSARWRSIKVSEEENINPLHLLWKKYITETEYHQDHNVDDLLQHDEFAQHIICINGITQSTWPRWKDFLLQYAHACRSVLPQKRSLLCISLTNELVLDSPTEDVCLSNHSLRSYIEPIDMLLYAAMILKKKNMPRLQKQVAIPIIANLALWDPLVYERFAYKPIEIILSPIDTLKNIGLERSWRAGIECTEERWINGIADTIDGKEMIHSAFLAQHGTLDEINRRIWTAQIGVLMPFVEEKRQQLISDLKDLLIVPHSAGYKVISDVRELEIGHIHYQANNGFFTINEHTKRLITRLRDIRNCLSHIEALSPELLLCEDIGLNVDTCT
ncbi:MAG: hypothetical protein HZB33_00900 [Nitrospirae bacterium]|nr:hypothetical protein [Nitrospirota bacterium]